MNIAFYIDEMNYRGVSNSTYQFAFQNEKILKNKSIVFYNKKNYRNQKDVINKFKKKFKIIGVSYFKEIETYKDKLVVLGFPCDQFGGQEPGNSQQILSFCKERYGVSFPLSEKIKVKGDNQHEIYDWLTNKKRNGISSTIVKWNFQKYLVSPNGNFIDYYYSVTKPLSEKITSHFK